MDWIAMDGEVIWQPDAGLKYSFETTYTEDSGRVITGNGQFTPLFTVEQLGYTATGIPVEEAAALIRKVIKGQSFILHYFSLYYGEWRDAPFYVAKGDTEIGELSDDCQMLNTLSFNMTGVNPI